MSDCVPFGTVQEYSVPPTSGSSDDHNPILAPMEMLVPNLTAWIKKCYLLVAIRVGATDLHPLVAVAQRTSQPEVFFCRRATSSQGNDMLHVHRHSCVCLWGQTVATPVTGLGGDFFSQGSANVRTRHVGYLRCSCIGTR